MHNKNYKKRKYLLKTRRIYSDYTKNTMIQCLITCDTLIQCLHKLRKIQEFSRDARSKNNAVTKLEYEDAIIRDYYRTARHRAKIYLPTRVRGTKVYQWYNTIPAPTFSYRRPHPSLSLHPSGCFIVDTSAECLSRLSDTSTSVESIVHFGPRRANR